MPMYSPRAIFDAAMIELIEAGLVAAGLMPGRGLVFTLTEVAIATYPADAETIAKARAVLSDPNVAIVEDIEQVKALLEADRQQRQAGRN